MVNGWHRACDCTSYSSQPSGKSGCRVQNAAAQRPRRTPQVVWDLAGDSGARAREARAGQRPVAETPEAIWRATVMLASERQASQTPPPTLLTVVALLVALELADRTRTGRAEQHLVVGTSIGDIGPFLPENMFDTRTSFSYVSLQCGVIVFFS